MTNSNLDDIHTEIRRLRRLHTWITLLIASVVFFFAKDILMPIILGFLITLTLTPIVRRFTKIGIPAFLAAAIVVVSVSSAIAGAVYLLSEPFGEMASSLPKIGENITAKLQPYQSTMNTISDASEQVQNLTPSSVNDEIQQVAVERPGLLSTAASTLASGIASILLALVLSLFLLGSGTLFYEKVVTFMPQLSEKKRALKIVYDVESSVSRYLLTITIINFLLGLTVGVLLHIYGVENAALWGVIVAVLNFLPFLGAFIGAALLALISIGVYDSLLEALIPPMIYLGCSIIEGNILTPLIVGRRLQLNVVAVFLTVAIWGWIWGLAGALMAVPILVVVNVLCDHIESWKPLGHFLSGAATPTQQADNT